MTHHMTSEEPLLPSQAEPKRSKAHEHLARFVGVWDLAGHYAPRAPLGKTEPVQGLETFTWLEGGFFLLYEWDRHSPSGNHVGLGHIGHVAEKNTYVLCCADNLGYARTYSLSGSESKWRITGEHEVATLEFSLDGGTLRVSWEHTSDGSQWRPLSEWTLTRRRKE